MLDTIDALTNMLTGTVEALEDVANVVSAFPSRRPVLTTVALTALVCAVGWPATHPHPRPERGKRHGRTRR